MATTTNEDFRFGKNKTKDGRTRAWTIVFYEDSAPENWRDIIANLHVPAYVSPDHNADVRADGTPKKAHRHLVLNYPDKRSAKQIQEVSDMLSGVRVDWEHCAVGNLRGMVRYLAHYDDCDKHPYPIEDILTYSGADVLQYFTDSVDVDECLRQAMKWCRDNGVTSFATLCDYSSKHEPSWFRVLTSKRTVSISTYLKAMRWEFEQGGESPLEIDVSRSYEPDFSRNWHVYGLEFPESENTVPYGSYDALEDATEMFKALAINGLQPVLMDKARAKAEHTSL